NGRLKFGRIFSPVEMAHKETPRALYAGAISPRGLEINLRRSRSERRLIGWPMTIRFKILALAFVILVVFGVVVGISTWLQHQFMNQIVAITRYHIPLRTLIADFDVRTDRYEVVILRLLRQPAIMQNELEATKSQARQEAKRIAEDLAQFDALVDKALADPTVARKSASIFSELKGATPFIERQLDPFFKIGDQVLKAAADS